MKTRLLRKIRKRFSWYKTTTNEYPEPQYWVLLDRKDKTVVVLNLEYLLEEYSGIKEEDVEPHYYDNLLKIMITKPFVEDYFKRIRYRKATRIYNRKKTKL